jgi:hypothetical protein
VGLFSCTKCTYFRAGPTPACGKGQTLIPRDAPGSHAPRLIVIDEGCDEFTVPMRIQGPGGTGSGGVRRVR